MNGQKAFTRRIGDVAVSLEVNLNIQNLQTGVYLVTVKGDQQYKTYHLLKQ